MQQIIENYYLKGNCNESLFFFCFVHFLSRIGPLVKVGKNCIKSLILGVMGRLRAAKVAHYRTLPVVDGVY